MTSKAGSNFEPPRRKGQAWWPAVVVLLLTSGVLVWIRARGEASFQERNLQSLAVLLGATAILLLWWLTGSPARWSLRLTVTAAFVLIISLASAFFRLRGVSGDLLPILEFRWHYQRHVSPLTPASPSASAPTQNFRLEFPQFLGPNRNAMLDGPAIHQDWERNPPKVLWRKPMGSAWSGWSIVGPRAFTQEQLAEGECSTCYDVLSGQLLWSIAELAHYQTSIAGEGPRCTPTVFSNRVFTLGATGKLNCLDLETGRRFWSRDIVKDAASHVPEWGFAGSPLISYGNVVVSGGGNSGRSLLAYHVDNGQLAWSGGDQSASYSSPVLVSLSGVSQILSFDHRRITAYDPSSGKVLWDYPWGNGQPQVAVPVVVSSNRVVFSSGYGVGSEMLEVNRSTNGQLAVRSVWRSRKLKAKFANLVQRDGFLFGLDDGVLACLDLSDGSQRWKEGRYGHGQGLLVRDLFLLMAENGELVLLQPTPVSPGELQRFRLFHGKTWNPIALSGDLLLARNDQEAACLRLSIGRDEK
jgi:outer membrane protein assembly factor BamB